MFKTEIFAKAVKYFFSSKLGIGIFPFHLRDIDSPNSHIIILTPFQDSKNMLTLNDIEKITSFFVKEMGMKGDGVSFQKKLEKIREKGLTNASPWLEFQYNALFVVEIPIIYAKINDKEYFFLTSITIEDREDDDEEIENIIITRAKEVLKGTETLKELENLRVEEDKKFEKIKDKYPELMNTLEEFGIPFSGKGTKLYIKADVKPNSLEISLNATMTCITDNGVKIIIKESLFNDNKSLIFSSPDGKVKEVVLDKNTKFDYKYPHLILKLTEE